MDMRKEFHGAVFFNVSNFIKMVEKIEREPQFSQFFKKAPQALTKNRSFSEMAIDDALGAFEKIMRDIPEKDIPIGFYLNLLKSRQGPQVTPQEARTRLTKNITALRAAPASPGSDDSVPDFLKIIIDEAPLNLVQDVANGWSALVQNMGQLTMSSEAILTRKSSVGMANSMAAEINQRLQARLGSKPGGAARPQPGGGQQGGGGTDTAARLDLLLSLFGEDLTERARNGELPEIIARDDEILQMTAALIQKDNPFALSVGDEGAGKSAVTEGLAQKIADGKVPAKLKDARVIRLNLKEMKATSGQGQRVDERTGEAGIVDQFNERLHFILSQVAEQNAKGGPQVILNLPELGDMAGRIPTFFQAKDVLSSVMGGKGGLRLIGEISGQKYNVLESEAKDLLGQFQKVRIAPLSADNTVALLRKEASVLKTSTGVNAADDLLNRMVKMSSRFLPTQAQPASALDTLEASVAYAEACGETELTEEHVANVISNLTGVPKEFIGSSMSERIATLGEELPKAVIGQPSISKIVSKLRIANANLKNPNKPLGSFMMIGPTGVGKTETAKALADHLGVPLITEDMSSYMDQHAKAKLVGAPPGYVGFDKEAALEQVVKSPYCVLLLDEIEKAHPDIFNLLLSVLDEGRLQLMNGKTVDFKNTVILMSSNLGAREAEAARGRKKIGFSAQEHNGDKAAEAAYRQQIEQKLPPEFINRLDGILQYERLAEEVVRKIAVKKIRDVSEFLRDQNHNITLELSPKAMDELLELGYDPRYGARPMERAVEDYVKDPLAEWIIENVKDVTEPTVLYVSKLKDGFNMEPRKRAASNAPKPGL